MPELHIWTNGEEWVIAESANDALLVAAENGAYANPADYQRDTGEMPSSWEQIEDGPFPINCEGDKVIKHTSIWIAEQGRGYLCGRDY